MAVSTGKTVALQLAGVAVVSTLLAQLRRIIWVLKRRAAKRNAPKLANDADLLRLGYSAKKVPTDVDHIIVGSGLSGLYAAALLSKIGRKVLVLEQHYVAGGCTHTFKDKGFEFDTGVHYVGQGTQLMAMMDFGAGKQGAFKMTRSGTEAGDNVYNEIQIGDRKFKFRPGKENFIGDLLQKFPQEEAAIRAFFREVLCGAAAMGMVSVKPLLPAYMWSALLKLPGPARWLANRYIKRTLSTVLTDCGITDEHLKGVLSAECGDYGVIPDETPFFLHAVILFHYIWEGAFYPEGGSDAFAEALLPTIVNAGGSVLVRAPVSKIILENGRAVGVEVKGKDVIRAKNSIISAAGVEVTYRKLLDEVDVQKMGGVPKSLLATEAKGTAHHVYAFIGLDGTSQELGLPTHNIWSYPTACTSESPDLNTVWTNIVTPGAAPPATLVTSDGTASAYFPAFMSFPSAKEPLYNSRCPGKSTAVVITEARAEYFGTSPPHGKRGQAYEDMKAKYKEVLVNAFLRHFPSLKSKIAYVDVGTPWSNDFYLGRAGSYGLDADVPRFLDPTLTVKPANVRGLYLTGQDMLCCGVFAQPIVAWMTLAKVLGITSLDFWLLSGDLVMAVLRRSIFNPGPTHPGIRELCSWMK